MLTDCLTQPFCLLYGIPCWYFKRSKAAGLPWVFWVLHLTPAESIQAHVTVPTHGQTRHSCIVGLPILCCREHQSPITPHAPKILAPCFCFAYCSDSCGIGLAQALQTEVFQRHIDPIYQYHVQIVAAQIRPTPYILIWWNHGTWAVYSCLPDMSHKKAIQWLHIGRKRPK